MFPASAVHTVASQSIITGPIDKPLLAEALVQLFQRHVALRLSPIIQKGVVLDRQQEVRCPDRLLSLHDVSAEPDAWQSGLSLARALGQRSIPFNGDVTFRFDLIRISDTCHIWVGAYHHINMDAWANGILMRELAELYSALVAGRPPCWSEFVDYRMCIDGDQAHLDSDRWSKNAAFWGALHDRAPERLVECPPTFLRSVNGALSTRLVRRQLPSSLVERLRAFGAAAGVGLNQVFTLGILAVLGKQASVAELAFGMSVLNRRNALEKNTFGLFSLVVAPKIEVMPDDNVNALLAKLEKSTKAAMRHSRYALSELNRQLASQYGQSVPLFDVNISYERVDFGVLPFGQAEMGVPTVLLNGVERNPVELFIRDYGDQRQVEIDLEVSATLFDERNADALADRYVLLLERLLDCANEPLSGVSLLEDSERDWLVNGVNETA
ncbi:MAG: condensation domain-containing protein, partial [Halieaceae bacterium]|nr:condensation domain-containing protein [Halieaceae bacterium]